MIQFKPTSIQVTESTPGSVATFRINARAAGGFLRTKDFAASAYGPGPVYTLPLGASFFQPGDEGRDVIFGVVEFGHDGSEAAESTEMNDDGVGNKTHPVIAVPDGPEGIHVID